MSTVLEDGEALFSAFPSGLIYFYFELIVRLKKSEKSGQKIQFAFVETWYILEQV